MLCFVYMRMVNIFMFLVLTGCSCRVIGSCTFFVLDRSSASSSILLVMQNFQSQLMVLIEKAGGVFRVVKSWGQKTKGSPDGNWHLKMLYKFVSSSQGLGSSSWFSWRLSSQEKMNLYFVRLSPLTMPGMILSHRWHKPTHEEKGQLH